MTESGKSLGAGGTPRQGLKRGIVRLWQVAMVATAPPRRKKRRRFPEAVAEDTTQRRACHRPPDMTRGQLYAYHQRNGTLGLFYLLFPDEAPAF
jgi:hypothetical protein